MSIASSDRSEWIRFGDGPAMILHPDTAAAMLGQLHREDPARFGRFVAIAMTGVAPRGGTRQASGQDAGEQDGAGQ